MGFCQFSMSAGILKSTWGDGCFGSMRLDIPESGQDSKRQQKQLTVGFIGFQVEYVFIKLVLYCFQVQLPSEL